MLFEFANEETYDGRIKALPQPTSAPAACISVRVEDSPEARHRGSRGHPRGNITRKKSLGIIAFSRPICPPSAKELDSAAEAQSDHEAFFNQKDAVNVLHIRHRKTQSMTTAIRFVFAEVTRRSLPPGLGTKLINLCATRHGRTAHFHQNASLPRRESGAPATGNSCNMRIRRRAKMYSGNSLVSPFVGNAFWKFSTATSSHGLRTNWGFRGCGPRHLHTTQ